LTYREFCQKIKCLLVSIYDKLGEPPVPNLKGDRDIEHSWISANIPEGPGLALDFGCGPFWIGLLAARKGFTVTAIDLEPVIWYYEHPSLRFLQGNILKLPLPTDHYDLIINCSSIEHVGLAGRYGVTESRPDGDIEVMTILKNLLKPGKVMLLTIPVGRDQVFDPLHRVYGQNRLPKLLGGWKIQKSEFWVKDAQNRWIIVEKSIALNMEPVKHYYGLGLFVLRRPESYDNYDHREGKPRL
jgi:SAM-dependent methyltransferase